MTTKYRQLKPGEPHKLGDIGDHIGGGIFEYKRPIVEEGDRKDG